MIQNPNCSSCFAFETHCAQVEAEQERLADLRQRIGEQGQRIPSYNARLILGDIGIRLSIVEGLNSMGVEATYEVVNEIDIEQDRTHFVAATDALNAASSDLQRHEAAVASIDAQLHSSLDALRSCGGPLPVTTPGDMFRYVMRGAGPCAFKRP